MLKVLFVASEAVPFAKTGGLADVAGSLPKALRAQGIDVRVVLPKYGAVPEKYQENMRFLFETTVDVSWRRQYCGVLETEQDGVPVYFIDNEYYFKRDGFYGYEDDAERFAFFSRAVLDMLPEIGFEPDVIHCNDWHTGLVGVFLKLFYQDDARYAKIKNVFTIHNLKYQGVFSKQIVPDVLGLEWKYFNNGDLEFFDAVNYMKGGIVYADVVTTVSRTYAKEVQYPYFGEKLDALLRSRADMLHGILNGIDYDEYNPKTDAHIFARYDAEQPLGKVENKVELQKQLGLPVRRDVPLLAIVSRLVAAKGIDLISHIIDELLTDEDVQLVVLGTGDRHYEDLFKSLAWRYPTKVSANILFHNELAHRIYAASDLFLMPSQYEPCGIGQLIALRYGSIPVVRETGGLKDTIEPYNKYARTGNGFTFANYNAHELLFAIKRALGLYSDTSQWDSLVKNAMTSDYSWRHSAELYKALYAGLCGMEG